MLSATARMIAALAAVQIIETTALGATAIVQLESNLPSIRARMVTMASMQRTAKMALDISGHQSHMTPILFLGLAPSWKAALEGDRAGCVGDRGSYSGLVDVGDNTLVKSRRGLS